MTAAGEVIPLGKWLLGFSEGEKIPLLPSLYLLQDFMVPRCQSPRTRGKWPHLPPSAPIADLQPNPGAGPWAPCRGGCHPISALTETRIPQKTRYLCPLFFAPLSLQLRDGAPSPALNSLQPGGGAQ